jgi:hypothetical protein
MIKYLMREKLVRRRGHYALRSESDEKVGEERTLRLLPDRK